MAENLSILPTPHAKQHLLVVANARYSASDVCALRLKQALFGALLGHAQKTPCLWDGAPWDALSQL
jgi:hypothetical protein